jgi:hypothetical protein
VHPAAVVHWVQSVPSAQSAFSAETGQIGRSSEEMARKQMKQASILMEEEEGIFGGFLKGLALFGLG